MIAVSLVHGGPSPGFFSKVLFDCLVYGPENVKPNLDDVADAGVAQTINKVNKATFTGEFLCKSVFGYEEELIKYNFSSNLNVHSRSPS